MRINEILLGLLKTILHKMAGLGLEVFNVVHFNEICEMSNDYLNR